MTQLHTHIKDGEVMRMRQVEAIDVPAHGEVALKPGSYHVMFMKLKAPLKKGEKFPLELTFEKGWQGDHRDAGCWRWRKDGTKNVKSVLLKEGAAAISIVAAAPIAARLA